jgi:hypothetical protein
MHKIKEMLMNELYEYEEKAKKMPNGKLSTQELEKIHKLTDTVKNIDKIEMLEDGEGYSEDTDFMGEGRMYGTSYDGGYDRGTSYARRGRGRNARRDRMGRYSSDDGMSYARDGRTTNRGGMRDNMGGSSYGMSYDGAKERLMDKAEEMLEMAQDPKERRAIEKFMRELED